MNDMSDTKYTVRFTAKVVVELCDLPVGKNAPVNKALRRFKALLRSEPRVPGWERVVELLKLAYGSTPGANNAGLHVHGGPHGVELVRDLPAEAGGDYQRLAMVTCALW